MRSKIMKLHFHCCYCCLVFQCIWSPTGSWMHIFYFVIHHLKIIVQKVAFVPFGGLPRWHCRTWLTRILYFWNLQLMDYIFLMNLKTYKACVKWWYDFMAVNWNAGIKRSSCQKSHHLIILYENNLLKWCQFSA